jgi:hypothetical protein
MEKLLLNRVKIFVDESKNIKLAGRNFILYGALVIPPFSVLSQSLEKLRFQHNFFEEIKKEKINSDTKTKLIANDFINAFFESDCNFRLLKTERFNPDTEMEESKRRAIEISPLLIWLYIHFKGNVYTHSRNAIILIDEQNLKKEDESEFCEYLRRRLIEKKKYPNNIKDILSFDMPRIDIINSQCFDELQLTDLLTWLFRRILKDEELSSFIEKWKDFIYENYNLGSEKEINRFKTEGKLNLWEFRPRREEFEEKEIDIEDTSFLGEEVDVEDIPF